MSTPVRTYEKGDPTVPFFVASGAGRERSGHGRQDAARLLDLVPLDALGADPNPPGLAIDLDADRLEVGVPAAVGPVVRVAYVMTGHRSLATDGADARHTVYSLRISPSRYRQQS